LGYNSLGYKCGIVRVFDWSGTSWLQRGNTIEGEGNINPIFDGDVFGTALELSADGDHIVVGARSNTQQVGVLQLQGHARVYNWNGTSWVQIGQDIDGDNVGGVQQFGYAVSINKAGDRVAIGARDYNGQAQGSGLVKIFEFDGNAWVQMGSNLVGTSLGEGFGTAVRLTKDGNTVAVGAPGAGANSTGTTKVFTWNGSNWVQRGTDINGVGSSKSGFSIDISEDGAILAIGEPWRNSFNGSVRLFKWDNNSWQNLGITILPAGPISNINAFGSAVRLNNIGSRVIVGAPSNSDVGSNFGEVSVYNNPSVIGLNEALEVDIQIYPNPSSGLFYISGSNQIEEIYIYNLMGELIATEAIHSTQAKLNLSQAAAGIYVLRIQTQTGVQLKRISKL
jgi:hypothetical protein